MNRTIDNARVCGRTPKPPMAHPKDQSLTHISSFKALELSEEVKLGHGKEKLKHKQRQKSGGGEVPKEVSEDVLTRLPVRSLFECLPVCKRWDSILEDPSHVDKHFSCSLARPDSSRMLVSFSNLDGSKNYFFSVGLYGGSGVHHLTLPGCNKGPNKPCHCHVTESVKGQFCFFNGCSLFVCNPATRSVQPIPKSLEFTRGYESVDTVFYKSYSAYGFGFDPSTNVFKVLHIMGTQQTGMKFYDLECEIYTCVSINGFIYWLGMSAPGVESLVRFDVGNYCPNDNSASAVELWRLDDDERSKYSWIKESFEVPRSHKRLKLPVPLGNICSSDLLLVADTPS
ncbi:putative F-box/kelch-repeat protein At3g17570 [Durio zibethinus]|uniref:F-box/kelch-repeat protein At3g17570 n=1 Tax=Durio zibethinus TaxID=66656 RepID=A0A6P6AME0_DURZI|nr:putative F-box/kelch-repeat protein At3g17570 [Durio zibethinus]